MKKKTSYQKLKEENKKLKRDIYLILRESETIDGITTNIKWNTLFDIEEQTLNGESTNSDLNGLL